MNRERAKAFRMQSLSGSRTPEANPHGRTGAARRGPFRSRSGPWRKLTATVAFFIAAIAGAEAQDESNPGSWEGPYQFVDVSMVHSALLPTGHLLAFKPLSLVWDPAARTILSRPLENTNLYCSGTATMADGRLLAAGGTFKSGGVEMGRNTAEIFDPVTRQWTLLPNMPGGNRYYPSAVALPDGQIMVWNGTSAGVVNPWVDYYNPATNTWTTVSNRTYPKFYPHMHVVFSGVSGEVFVSGGSEPFFYNLSTRAWRNAPLPNVQNRLAECMSSVLLPFAANAASQKVLIIGGGADWSAPLNSAETFTFDSTGAGSWQMIPPMSVGRTAANAVLLPSGEVLVAGGTYIPPGQGWDNLESAEIYSPTANAWRTVSPMTVGRGYHSSAVLLPDGSVAHGGGDINDAGGAIIARQTDMEVYKPWYFTAPSRPSISSAPAQAGYGSSIDIGTPDVNISKVLLIRTSSATHSLNSDQRLVELPFTFSAGTIAAQTPASPSLAPPGSYMLFLRNSSNVPSTARFVRLTPAPGTLPTVTVAATDPAASETGPDTGTFTVTRTGSTAASLAVTVAISGSAANGADYNTLGTSMTIPAGNASATVTVTPVDDATVEPVETVTLALSPSASYTVGSPGGATVTIADNDSPPSSAGTLQFGAPSYTVGEGGGTATVTVTRTGGSSGAVSVNYAASNGTATAGDYGAASGTLTWANANTAAKTFTVAIIEDPTVEPNETVNLALSSPGGGAALGAPSSAVLTIVDNDSVLPAPSGVAAMPGNGRVTVVWGSVGGATSYTLYMASTGGVTKANYASLPGGMRHASATSPYVTTGLANGTTYHFVVTASNASGESSESVEVAATPTAGGFPIPDTDGDGYSDAAEIAAGSDPNNSLSTPVDTDGDGMADAWENANLGGISALPGDDPDGDGASNLVEVNAGTNPNNPDTDGDGFSDGVEIAAGSNPLDPASVPGGAAASGSGSGGCGATGLEGLLLLAMMAWTRPRDRRKS